MSSSNKEKKNKTRFLSPSFKKGAVKDTKEEEDNGFKIDLMWAGGEDEDSKSPSPQRGKRSSAASDNKHKDEKHNLATIKRGSEDIRDDNLVNATTNGHVKKLASHSQPGKGEDGFTKVNQDSFLVIQNEYKLNDFNIFSVMDGHGTNGHLISRFVTKYFTSFFRKNKKMNVLTSEDQVYQRLKKNNFDILKRAFHHAERDIGKSNFDANFSGTTCVMVFQVGSKIICANVGDSRAIMIKNDKIIPLSIDQKPNDPEEEKRIIQHGGEVSQYEEDGEKSGPFRVWKKGEVYPGIAMSRSIGDLFASTLGVIPEPVFTEETIDDDTNFIVVASDGVWEFMNNEKVKIIVNKYKYNQNAENCSKEIVDMARKLWEGTTFAIDDITCIVIFFDSF